MVGNNMLKQRTESPRKRTTLYRIGELAEIAGVTTRTIRYYEELGILPLPLRPQAHHRRYTEKDLLHLHRVQQLKGYGLTLSEIREIFDLAREDPSGEMSRLRLLSRYREKWDEATKRKQNIEAYINELKWHIDQLEGVENFQACPGEECAICRYTERCKFYNEHHGEGER